MHSIRLPKLAGRTVRTACALAAAMAPFLAQAQDAEPAAPRNVIVMIIDGGGFNQHVVADYYQHGESGKQAYQQGFDALAATTYSASSKKGYDPEEAWKSFGYVKRDATDSAAAATALATGVKTTNGVVGLDPDGNPLPNMLDAAKALGKAMGVVSTVPLCHATPAGFVARNEKRGEYEALARQMIVESATDVIIGAGHPDFDPNGAAVTASKDAEAEKARFAAVGGRETWEGLKAGSVGADANGDGVPDPWSLIETREQFIAAAQNPPARLLGVFQNIATAQQERAGLDDKVEDDAPYQTPLLAHIPTLAEMTEAALAVLGKDEQGFFLMVEGGAVDWACHANQLGRTIEEMIDFNDAAASVVAWVEKNGGWERNLVVVTADHETGYLTGPASDPEWTDVVNNGRGNLPGAEFHSDGHTNSLVPFLVRGAGVEEFRARATQTDPKRGPYLDNTDLPKLIRQLWGVEAPAAVAAAG